MSQRSDPRYYCDSDLCTGHKDKAQDCADRRIATVTITAEATPELLALLESAVSLGCVSSLHVNYANWGGDA